MERKNLAARAGAWSAAHWKTATFGWFAFVALAFVLGGMAGKNILSESEAGDGEAGRAQKTLANAGFKQPAGESVLIQSRRGDSATDPRFQETVRAVIARVSKVPVVANVHSPLEGGVSSEGLISQDGRSALVNFDLKGDADSAQDRVQPVLDAVASVQKTHPEFVVEEYGTASANKALDDTLGKDFQRAEVLAVPATLIIMLFAFGALVAAGLPVLLAFSAVLGSMGISALLSHLLAASDATQSVILLVGMAVGVDYSLFYLKREREERARGASPHDALLKTAATSGEAVLISGATVLVAMAGMLFAGDPTFRSIGIGTMVVVAAAMLGSISVLPALLHKLGDRVEKARIPFLHRLRASDGESRFWKAILTPVLRRPLVWGSLAAAALVALTIPAFSLETKFPSITELPKSIPIVNTFTRAEKAFPGEAVPAVIVVKSRNVDTLDTQQAILDMRDQAVASGGFALPADIATNPAKTVTRVTLPIAAHNSRSKEAYAALANLREKIIPRTVGAVAGTDVAVTGETAANRDFNDLMKTHLPIVFAFVLALAFLLLLVTFRSIVIPIKSIVLNLLSVGASYGILVLVFQHTWAEGALDFTSNGGIVSWLPLFLFVLLFGLSMDYHVFILSRVKELVDGGMKTEEAVARGIRTTAGTVTSAAIVMVAVFSIFATLSSIDMKQMGFGLAVAVLLDATIIRGVLLPATMKVLGDWNWYLPSWLEWIPGGHRERAPEVPAAAPVA